MDIAVSILLAAVALLLLFNLLHRGRRRHTSATTAASSPSPDVTGWLWLLSDPPLLGIFIIKDDRIVFSNSPIADITGYSIEEMQRWMLSDLLKLVHTGDLAAVSELIERRKSGDAEGEHPCECRITQRGGAVRWISVGFQTVMFAGGKALAAVVIETTERRRTQEAVARAKQEWERTMDTLPDLIAILDQRSRITRLNRAMADKLGVPLRKAIGKLCTLGEHSDPPPHRLPESHPEKRARTTEVYDAQLGGYFLVTSTPLQEPDGKPVGSVRVAHDITELKRIEAALRISEKFSRVLVALSPVGIAYIDSRELVSLVNPALAKMLEIKEEECDAWQGRPLGDLPGLAGCGLERHIPRLASGDPVKVEEVELTLGSGVRKVLSVYGKPHTDPDGKPLGAVIMFVDITDYKELQAQIRQMQKMEAVGTLAGGIAHDFNNLLLAILGNTELALKKLKEQGLATDNIEAIQRSADRAAQLTSQLLAFGRRRMEQPKPTNLNGAVDEVLSIIGQTALRTIKLRAEKEPALWTVMADPGQLSQVLMNLLVNAVDALPDGGNITVRTENVTLDDRYCLTHHDAAPGEYVRLSVADNGVGIPPQVLPRIFEPFFTTKETGKGSGLGLAVVYGIVKAHQGWIDVSSTPGEGSRFIIHLPRAAEVEAEKAREPEAEEAPGGSETVLIVDDEEEILELGRTILEEVGYRVLTAEDGLKALEVYTDEGGAVDLVILDVSMPRMSGRETLQELKKLKPHLKVIVSSGYDRSGPAEELLAMGASGFIQKPYRLQRLLEAVRKAVDGEML